MGIDVLSPSRRIRAAALRDRTGGVVTRRQPSRGDASIDERLPFAVARATSMATEW